MKLHLNALAAGVLLASASLAPAFAAEQPATEPTTSQSTSEAGMRVYRDPETGALSSQPTTTQQRADAQAADAQFTENPAAVTDATATDGSPMRVLNGQHELAMGVEVDADGNRSVLCNEAAHLALGKHSHAAKPATTTARDER
jgi:hypothetical protein